MLDEICKYLKNWFETSHQDGVFEISDGTLTVPKCQTGQYIRIVGSVLNDGIYTYPLTGLKDETFKGSVWLLIIPKYIEDLDTKITEFVSENKKGGYSSESFGGYSYSKSTNKNGNISGWQDVFNEDLKPYKKI